MKLSKFFIAVVLVTIISLCYVYQKTQIFLLSYKHGRDKLQYQSLLDKNISLKYNLAKAKSVSHIGSKIFVENNNFEMPNDSQISELEVSSHDVAVNNPAPRETFLSRVFDAKLEVQAGTIR